VRLVSEGVDDVIAVVHGVSEHVQLLENTSVCDLPSHGLIDDDLCPEQDPAEAILHVRCCWLEAIFDKEIYGSCCQLVQNSSKENIHLGDSPLEEKMQEEDATMNNARAVHIGMIYI